MTAWPAIKLGEVVRPVARPFAPQPGTTYRQIGVRLWGGGAYEREPLDGSATKYSALFTARENDIVVNKIWARNGSVAVVPPSLDGTVGSSEFPMFELNRERLVPAWMHWLTKTPAFWTQCDAKSQGTSGKNRIRPEQFLSIEIPLPPLPEQQRLVSRIGEVSRSLEDALRFSTASDAETAALARVGRDAVYARLAARHTPVEAASLCCSITDGDHNTPAFSGDGVPFIFVGNVSSGSLHFDGSKRVQAEYFARLSPSRVPRRGDILFSAVGATLGVPAVVDTDQAFCFQRHIAILKPQRERVLPQYLWHMLMSRTCFDMAWESTTGSAQPTIPLRAIRTLRIPEPPLSEQRGIVAELDGLQAQVGALEALQTTRRAKLDALLPAILARAFAGAL